MHHQLTNYHIEWDSSQDLTYSTNYYQRLTLENWYTNLEQTPLNTNLEQTPLNTCMSTTTGTLHTTYPRRIHDENETHKRTSSRPNRLTKKLD